MPSPSVTLSAARAQALDDWRIRAGLYGANDKPAILGYLPDASLGSASGACRAQRTRLKAYRPALLKAPDAQLAAAAHRFDTATTQLLQACVANDPVALQHAKGAMSVAATDVNIRFNRLIGKDPSSFYATRVL